MALGGRSAMGDAKLRAAIFEPPDSRPVIPRTRRPSRRELRDNPELAAQWAGAYGAGGLYIAGSIDGGGGFDGGGGGGDGGGGF